MTHEASKKWDPSVVDGPKQHRTARWVRWWQWRLKAAGRQRVNWRLMAESRSAPSDSNSRARVYVGGSDNCQRWLCSHNWLETKQSKKLGLALSAEPKEKPSSNLLRLSNQLACLSLGNRFVDFCCLILNITYTIYFSYPSLSSLSSFRFPDHKQLLKYLIINENKSYWI